MTEYENIMTDLYPKLLFLQIKVALHLDIKLMNYVFL